MGKAKRSEELVYATQRTRDSRNRPTGAHCCQIQAKPVTARVCKISMVDSDGVFFRLCVEMDAA